MPQEIELDYAAQVDEFFIGLVGKTNEDIDRAIDLLECAMVDTKQTISPPLEHTFTKGLYCRKIFMPAGCRVVSKIHMTEHPYVILRGKVSVWTESYGVVLIEAPYHGVTKPGTRRVLFVHEDTEWLTFHPTDETDIQKIENSIIKKRDVTKSLEEGPESKKLE